MPAHPTDAYAEPAESADTSASCVASSWAHEPFIIDEIGKMECFSRRFVERVNGVLDGDVPLLSTIAMRGGGFIEEVKNRDDTELITVHVDNRDGLVNELADRIRSQLRLTPNRSRNSIPLELRAKNGE